MRRKGNRVKPRAYQAATTNGYRHESRKCLISSGIKTHSGQGTMKLLSSGADND
jgi:hypothetical protein